jgi:hypothetical protein
MGNWVFSGIFTSVCLKLIAIVVGAILEIQVMLLKKSLTLNWSNTLNVIDLLMKVIK